MTTQDNLAKYSDAISLRSTESTAIASAFAEHYITRVGCPHVIHIDQGSDFTSRVCLENDTKSYKLDREYSGPYKIIQIFHGNTVKLDLGKQKTRIVHINRLRPQTLKIFPESQ